jgi:hypothetical protein
MDLLAAENRMKFSTTLVFSLLFLVVVGFYIFLTPPAPPPKSTPTPALPMQSSSALIDPSDSVIWLQIQNVEKGETITLVPQGNSWMLKSPISYPATAGAVEEMIRILAAEKKVRELTPEKDWGEYGLSKSSIQIGLQTKNVPRKRYLYLGGLSPVADLIFARWEGGESYFLLNADLKRMFDRSIYSLREKRIFRTPFSHLSKIEFQAGSFRYVLFHRKKQWIWLKPDSIRGIGVDESSMNGLLGQMRNLFIKDFLDSGTEKNDFGFFESNHVVKVWGFAKEKEILHIGQEAPARDAFYARRGGEEIFILVDRSHMRALFENIQTISQEPSALY